MDDDSPILILENNIVHHFESVHPRFKDDVRTIFKERGPKAQIQIHVTNAPIVDSNNAMCAAEISADREISLFEPFLRFLWGGCYILSAYYYAAVYLLSKFRNLDHLPEHIPFLANAGLLFEYVHSLKHRYSPWPAHLPRPDQPGTGLGKEYVGRANNAFGTATAFILCHEFAHAVLGHVDGPHLGISSEEDADAYARDLVLRDTQTEEKKFNVCVGTMAGLSCLMLVSRSLQDGSHPSPDRRVKEFMEELNLDENDGLWAIPCFAYRIWDITHKVDLDYGPNNAGTYKQLFYKLFEQ